MSTNDAWVGDVLDGRYLLLKRVGAGAAGTVWQARDLERDIDVAVKVLASQHLASAEIVARFVREGDLASRMLSPHIVRVLARGVTPDHGPYVVYEHLEGEDLATTLASRGRLPIVDVRMIVVHTCRALARAHVLGVLHRDVKPSNLFMGTDSEGRQVVKTIDFGVADIVGSPHGAELVGTLEYIAPEVLFGEGTPDTRSDLYALAVVAYECFTGRVPFPAETIEELVLAFAKGAPPKPSDLRRGLPREVDAWFAKALHRKPEERFQSAKEMADALHAALECMDHTPVSSGIHSIGGSIRARAASVFDDREGEG